MRSSRGQASVEWVALLALVVLVLGSAAAITFGGLGVKVAWAIRRGICTVGASRCPAPPPDRADLPACPLARSMRSQDFDVRLAFVDLGGGLGVQEERDSDGRVTVTFTNSGSAGGVVGVGASFALGRLAAGVGASAEGAVRFTEGRSWTFPDRAAAERFVKRYGADQHLVRHVLDDARRICFFCGALGIGAPPTPPPADVTYTEGGLHVDLAAVATALWGGEAVADLGAALGYSTARASGQHTVYLRLSALSSGDLFAAAGLGATGGATGIAQVTLDRGGRPVALRLETVTAHALLDQAPARQSPGAAAPPPAQLVRDLHGGGTVKEMQVDLDLTDRLNAAAAWSLLTAALHDPASVGEAASAFSRYVDAHGTTTLRTFASHDGRGGIGAALAVGVEAGGAYSHTSQDLKLTGVYTRLPGLGFLPRADCLTQ